MEGTLLLLLEGRRLLLTVWERVGDGKGIKSQSAPPHHLPPPLDGVRGAAMEGESLEGREAIWIYRVDSLLLMRILHFGFPLLLLLLLPSRSN